MSPLYRTLRFVGHQFRDPIGRDRFARPVTPRGAVAAIPALRRRERG